MLDSEEDDDGNWTEDDDCNWTDDGVVAENAKSTVCDPAHILDTGEVDAPGSSQPSLFSNFIGMGFSEDAVMKAIKENGEDDADAVLETLLTYSALEISHEAYQNFFIDGNSSESKNILRDKEFFDTQSSSANKETRPLLVKEKNMMLLIDMGFTKDEATAAVEKCPNASLIELQDFIYAIQIANEGGAQLHKLGENGPQKLNKCLDSPVQFCKEQLSSNKKRKWSTERAWQKNCTFEYKKLLETPDYCKELGELGDDNDCINDDDTISDVTLPSLMIGFGVPDMPHVKVHRKIPEAAMGPPYFYYENVALAPKGVWGTISRFLYDIEPEFVDSKFFCAAARKRGYIHNLPIHNRYPLMPLPPCTIQEAFPLSSKWWPSWDPRKQLNCLQSCIASSTITERIRASLSGCSDPPPLNVQKYVLSLCRKWNLLWVGPNKVAPLEPYEMEVLLGYPKDHTRGGVSRTERYRSLGNSFQVETLAYHFSVLKHLFPNGMTVLSLFSGIGGAEVALHRLGINLKVVVSVEKSEINRDIFRSWWEQTNQKGKLIDFSDVQEMTAEKLEQLINTLGGFDLIVGGSPCNNLSGSNRISRDGLEGKHSSLFFDYFRILDLIKNIMERNL